MDALLEHDCFVGRVQSGQVNCAVIGSTPNSKGILKILDECEYLNGLGEISRATFGPKLLSRLLVPHPKRHPEITILPYPYFYWKSRSSETIFQAWGISETFENLDSCPRTKLPRFASFRFSDSKQSSTWDNFPTQLIWTPRWCLEQGEKDILYFNPYSVPEIETIGGYEYEVRTINGEKVTVTTSGGDVALVSPHQVWLA